MAKVRRHYWQYLVTNDGIPIPNVGVQVTQKGYPDDPFYVFSSPTSSSPMSSIDTDLLLKSQYIHPIDIFPSTDYGNSYGYILGTSTNKKSIQTNKLISNNSYYLSFTAWIPAESTVTAATIYIGNTLVFGFGVNFQFTITKTPRECKIGFPLRSWDINSSYVDFWTQLETTNLSVTNVKLFNDTNPSVIPLQSIKTNAVGYFEFWVQSETDSRTTPLIWDYPYGTRGRLDFEVTPLTPVGKTGVQSYIDDLDLTASPMGLQGPDGPPGNQGPTGPTGISITGLVGDRGEPYTTGRQGPTGRQGATGPTGYQGSTGVVSTLLSTGKQGPTGPRGITGATSMIQGEDGEPGPLGRVGARGPRGQTGAQGPQGNTGDQGPEGDQGDPNYTRGPQGDRGDTGDRGEPGKDKSVDDFFVSNNVASLNGSYGAKTTLTIPKAGTWLISVHCCGITNTGAHGLSARIGSKEVGVFTNSWNMQLSSHMTGSTTVNVTTDNTEIVCSYVSNNTTIGYSQIWAYAFLIK